MEMSETRQLSAEPDTSIQNASYGDITWLNGEITI